jgi:hypothetical protein
MAGVDPWSYAERSGKEHAHQAALFMWANMAMRFGLTAAEYRASYTKAGVAQSFKAQKGDMVPQLKWLHAIHNQGHGDAVRGGKAKAEGVKAGVSDMFLPVPMRVGGGLNLALPARLIHGFYLELKVGTNTPSAEQLEFFGDMRTAGYEADWATGWLEARLKILAYLQINC